MTTNPNLQKKTLHFREGDWDYLTQVFRPNGVATSVAVRRIVSNYVDALRTDEQYQMPEIKDVKLDL